MHVPPPQPGVLLRPACPEPPVFNPKHAVSPLNRMPMVVAYRSRCPQAPVYTWGVKETGGSLHTLKEAASRGRLDDV